MQSCIFCKISRGEIPAPKVFENERFYAIRDMHPQAKAHLLVIPNEHIASLEAAFPPSGATQRELMGELLEVATQVAREQGLQQGFRVVLNTNQHGGQTVFHIHAHVIGGEQLKGGFGA